MNIAVEVASHGSGTFPNGLRGDQAQQEFHDLHSRIGRPCDRDQHAFTTFELDLTEALARVVRIAHDATHAANSFVSSVDLPQYRSPPSNPEPKVNAPSF